MSGTEVVFVEEYRKELSATGYPFTVLRPITVAEGYSLPIGSIADASVYCDSSSDLPKLTALEKQDAAVTLTVGRYAAVFDLNNLDNSPKEVVELYDAVGVFGGILVLNLSKVRVLRSWRNGKHEITPALSFCGRCLEIIPVMGVQRLRTDTDQIIAGKAVLTGGRGCLLRLLTSPSGVTYVETGFTGDPTYSIRAGGDTNRTPVQTVLCKDTFGTEIAVSPDSWNGISILACNTFESSLHEDALRLEITSESAIRISLGGL
jgi:hypothetical protein